MLSRTPNRGSPSSESTPVRRGKAVASASANHTAIASVSGCIGGPSATTRGKWPRSRWLWGTVAATILFVVMAQLYQSYGHAVPPPPDVALTGIDPAIATAVTEARSRIEDSPRSAAAWGEFGMVLLVHEFRPEAAICFDQAESLDPREPRWPYFQSLRALLNSDLPTAKSKLERTVQLCGDDCDAPQLTLAETLLGLEELDAAEKQFSLVLARDPQNARAQLGLARLAMSRGDFHGSLEPLSIAQKHPCTRRAAYKLLAELQERMGNEPEAEVARRTFAGLPADRNWPDPYRNELATKMTGKIAWLKQAESLEQQGERAEALNVFLRTVRIYPDADDAWLMLGKALYDRRMLRPAEEAFRRACALAPTTYEPFNELGRVLMARDSRAEAMTCFRKSLELKPNSAQVWYNLGNGLLTQGDRSGALEAYEKAVRFAPEMFESQFTLALMLADKGRAAEAIQHVELALRLRPNDQSARKLLGQLKSQRTPSRPGS